MVIRDEELRRLEFARGARLTAARLCTMRDCGETSAALPHSDLALVTWGVVLDLTTGPLAISWDEDTIGDPFRMGCPDADPLLAIDSLVTKDVSGMEPWRDLVDCTLDSFDILACESDTSERLVPWAIELRLGVHRVLVAAPGHDAPVSGLPCADEVEIATRESAIAQLVAARQGTRKR